MSNLIYHILYHNIEHIKIESDLNLSEIEAIKIVYDLVQLYRKKDRCIDLEELEMILSLKVPAVISNIIVTSTRDGANAYEIRPSDMVEQLRTYYVNQYNKENEEFITFLKEQDATANITHQQSSKHCN